MENNIQIKTGKKDVIWNYAATLLQTGSGILLYPVILNQFSSSVVGIWSIFMSITVLTNMLDFGFMPAFTRNISYIFSGAKNLKKEGLPDVSKREKHLDAVLLHNTIKAMKWFYSRISLLVFVLLLLAGTFYMYNLTNTSEIEDMQNIWYAWFLFILTNTYQLRTLYYDSLITGMGKIARFKQFTIYSQSAYILVSVMLILLGYGLLSVVIAQLIALIIRRTLSHAYLIRSGILQKDAYEDNGGYKEILTVISPNAIKVGITGLGAFLVLQSSTLVGSLFIDLKELASFGISIQLVNVTATLSMVYFNSHIPSITSMQVSKEKIRIRDMYKRSILVLVMLFVLSLSFILLFGNQILTLLNSRTFLIPGAMITVLYLINLLEKNHAIAGSFLLMKNEVPFFKAAIISGLATVAVLFVFMYYLKMGLWGMILAPGVVQLAYQNWKWPLVLIKDLKSDAN